MAGLFSSNAQLCESNEAMNATREQFFTIAKSADVTVMTVLLSLSGMVGIIGNGLVIAMCVKYPATQPTQSFILAMAVSDLLVCTAIIPYRIISYHVLINEISCKLFEGLTYCTVFYSCTLLMAVSFERYFAVCRPLSFVCTKLRSKYVILGLCSVSFVISVTAGLIAGHYIILTSPEDNSTVVCFTGICNEDGGDIRVMDERGIMIYSAVLGVVYAFMVPTVTILYGQVFWALHKRYGHFKKRMSRGAVEPVSGCSTATKARVMAGIQDTDVQVYSIDANTKGKDSNVNSDPKEQTSSYPTYGGIMKERATRKYLYHKRAATILVLVTLAFVLTYIPFLLMKLKLVENIITIRLSFFLSSMVNPLIYSFTNHQFRDNVKKNLNCW